METSTPSNDPGTLSFSGFPFNSSKKVVAFKKNSAKYLMAINRYTFFLDVINRYTY